MTSKCSVKRPEEGDLPESRLPEGGWWQEQEWEGKGGSSAGGESGLTGSASLAQRALNFRLKLLTCWYF